MDDNIAELEEEIIGILLVKPSRIDEFVLSIECFNNRINKILIKFICLSWKEHHSVDLPALIENYQHLIEKEVSINDFIITATKYATNMVTDANFEYLQETIFSRYKKRQTILQLKMFENKQISYDELISRINEISLKNLFEKEKELTGDDIYELIREEKTKLTFSYKKLTYFGNMQENDFIVIAARPGVGKTGLALNLCNQLSKKYKVLYFSMEMSKRQIYSRLLAITSGINMEYIFKPKTAYQNEKIKQYANELAKQKIQIITTPQTVKSIRSKIIRECKKEHIIVFIDYVGLIEFNKKYISIYERITDIVKELRNISLGYNCTIFLLSQLNRQSAMEAKLSDLKDSGELEQAGTAVLLLSKEDSEAITNEETMKLNIAKNRYGPTGIIEMKYNKLNQVFEEI